MRAVIVAGGPPGDDAFVRAQCAEANLLIGVDGGVLTLERLSIRPTLAVGDFDTAGPDAVARLRAAGVPTETHPAAKDATDTHLALLIAVERGATTIDLLGVLGGPRYDHMLAAVFLLALPALAAARVTLRDPLHTVTLLHPDESVVLNGCPGEYVSLFSLSAETTGVTGRGLRYPLPRTFALGDSLGVSNEFVGAEATVSIIGGLLLVMHVRLTASS